MIICCLPVITHKHRQIRYGEAIRCLFTSLVIKKGTLIEPHSVHRWTNVYCRYLQQFCCYILLSSSFHTVVLMITISMAVKHNNVLLNLITGCLYWLILIFDVARTFMLAYFGIIFLARHCLLKNMSALHFRTLDLMLL